MLQHDLGIGIQNRLGIRSQGIGVKSKADPGKILDDLLNRGRGRGRRGLDFLNGRRGRGGRRRIFMFGAASQKGACYQNKQ
jgi:hypothetical protein